MRGFWKIFKETAYFRLSWSVQDLFINAFTAAKREKYREALENNKLDILNELNNNEFVKYRKKNE